MAQSYAMSIQHRPRSARRRLGNGTPRRPAANAPGTAPPETRAAHDRGTKGNSSPRAGVAVRARGVKRAANDKRAAAFKRAPGSLPAPETWPQRFRLYAPSVIAPLAVLALAAVVLCLGTLLVGDVKLAYLPAVIGQTWLTLHAAPTHIDGVAVTAAPLLPALGIAMLLAARIRAVTRERVSMLDLGAILALLTASSLTLSVVAWFMVADAAHVFNVAAPHLALALLVPLGVHYVGFILGVRPELWRVLAKRAGVPVRGVDTLGTALVLYRNLLLTALGCYLVLCVLGYSRMAEAFAAYPNLNWSGACALVLISIAYLPNAAVATLATLLGGHFTWAGDSISLLGTGEIPAAALPPVPGFAAVPASIPAWAPALFLLPVGVVVHFALKRSSSLVDAAFTATWAALLGVIAALYSSGTVGAYGYVGASAWELALLGFGWAGCAALGAWARGLRATAPSNSAGANSPGLNSPEARPPSAPVAED